MTFVILYRDRDDFLSIPESLTLGLVIALAAVLGRRLVGPWVGAVTAVIVALFPSLIGHSALILTETTFNLPGLGTSLFNYLNARDYTAVQGLVTFFGVVVV